jgi:hypothetical protein
MQNQKRSDKEMQDEFTNLTDSTFDPLQKREKFAVSLRTQKRKEVINQKRKKTYEMMVVPNFRKAAD